MSPAPGPGRGPGEPSRIERSSLLELVGHSLRAILVIDGARRILACNELCGTILGADPQDVLGRPFQEVGSVPASLIDSVAIALRGAGSSGEGTFHRTDGSSDIIRWDALPFVIDPTAEPVTGIVIEVVTEQRRAAAIEHRLAEILRAMPDPYFLLDGADRIMELNDAARAMAGWSGDEPLGGPFDLLLPAGNGVLARGLVARCRRGETISSVETVFATRDGVRLPVLLTLTLVPGDDGDADCVAILAKDLTELRSARSVIDELRSDLLQSQKFEALGAMAAGIAHDFNNLLMAIHGSGELLVDGIPAESSLHRAAERVVSAATRGAALTRHLMTFAGNQSMQRRGLDLVEVVRDCVEPLERVLPEQVGLRFDLGEVPLRVEADPVGVEQALLNLVFNAVDAVGPDGSIVVSTRSVTVDHEQAHDSGMVAGQYAEVAVADDGHGMSPEVAARAFEPFYSTKPRGVGTGLGLSSVYGIVQSFGGVTKLETSPGRGTTVRILLPLAARAGDEPDPATRPRSAGRRRTILLVEDDELVREVLDEAFTRAGHAVVSTSDPRAAIGMATEHPIDVVVSDVVMAGLAGPDLVLELQRALPGLPAVLATAHEPDAELRLRLAELSDAVCLTKPCPPSDFLDAIETLCGRPATPPSS